MSALSDRAQAHIAGMPAHVREQYALDVLQVELLAEIAEKLAGRAEATGSTIAITTTEPARANSAGRSAPAAVDTVEPAPAEAAAVATIEPATAAAGPKKRAPAKRAAKPAAG